MHQQGTLVDNGDWQTMFLVCGFGEDDEALGERLGLKGSFIRSDEFPRPANAPGADRHFDARMAMNRWVFSLSGSQYKRGLVEQLGFWCQALSGSRKELHECRVRRYWTVIDCQGARVSSSESRSLQMSLPSSKLRDLSALAIDLEFTIYGAAAVEA
jgi:hypothetical protein